MTTITIAPIAVKNSITKEAYDAIFSTDSNNARLILQTKHHPTVKFITESDLKYETLDDLYENSADFDELNSRIAERLVCGKDVVYAVLGRGIGEAQLQKIKELAEKNNTNVKVLASSGFAESACAEAGIMFSGGQNYKANSIPENIDVYSNLIIEEIDTALRASEIKLKLMEYYPEACDCILSNIDDGGDYSHKVIKLYELDRQKTYGADTVLIVKPFEFIKLTRHGFEGVIEIMRKLRGKNGCPWDICQTHETLKTPLIEEAYEVLDAINENDDAALLEELGDLLLQVVFHAQIEAEKSNFTMRDVCTELVKKLIYRHPHVFGDVKGIENASDVLVAWEELKKSEKHLNSLEEVLSAVPKSFPSLTRCYKVQKKSMQAGEEFSLERTANAIAEIASAINEGKQISDKDLGDLLFNAVTIALLNSIDPEIALYETTESYIKAVLNKK